MVEARGPVTQLVGEFHKGIAAYEGRGYAEAIMDNQLLESPIHAVDLVRALANSPVAEVHSVVRRACSRYKDVFAALVLSACSREHRQVVGVVPKGANHIFWQTVHAGAIKASREFGFEIEWNAPTLEVDSHRQIEIVAEQHHRIFIAGNIRMRDPYRLPWIGGAGHHRNVEFLGPDLFRE